MTLSNGEISRGYQPVDDRDTRYWECISILKGTGEKWYELVEDDPND